MKYLGSVENSYFDWLIERSWVRVPFTRNGEVECDSSVGQSANVTVFAYSPYG